MKKMYFARYAVLGIFAVVGFVSCEKNDDSMTNVSAGNNETVSLPEHKVANLTARAAQGYYTVASQYKTSYTHYTSWHSIAPGFVSWWNCIATAEGAGTITVQDVINLGTGRYKTVSLDQLETAYSGLKVNGLYDDAFPGTTAESLLENYFMNEMDGGQPCAILINNNYNGQWKNVLVVVLSYKDGYVYYQDPNAQVFNSMTLSSFASLAKAASALTPPRINVVHW